MSKSTWHIGLMVLGVLAFVSFGMDLEVDAGVPFDTTYRIACAAICLSCGIWLFPEYRREDWFQNGLKAAALVCLLILISPLTDRSTSRGEIMLFALPVAAIMLITRISTYQVENVHQRAMRQQMILGLVVAIVFFLVLAIASLADANGS